MIHKHWKGGDVQMGASGDFSEGASGRAGDFSEGATFVTKRLRDKAT